MNQVFISLGSNLGCTSDNLKDAIKAIEAHIGNVVCISSLYETEPWKMEPGTNNFLNQVILIETPLTPEDLMAALLETERRLGRSHRSGQKKYESRIIDLDILFYNNQVLSTANISIPHPHLHQRKFVLEPLAEIAPLFIHPVLKKNIQDLLTECTDNTAVEKTVSK